MLLSYENYPVSLQLKLLLFIIFSLNLSGLTYAQNLYPKEQVVHVRTDDLHIQATVEIEERVVKTFNNREYFGYYKNSIVKMQGGYVGRLLEGEYEVYFSNNSLKEKGTFRAGLKHGEWKNWKESGMLVSIENWKEGIKNGQFTHFDVQGNPAKMGAFRENKWHGKIHFYEKGELKEVKVYKNGVEKEEEEKEEKTNKKELADDNKKPDKDKKKKAKTKKENKKQEPEKTVNEPAKNKSRKPDKITKNNPKRNNTSNSKVTTASPAKQSKPAQSKRSTTSQSSKKPIAKKRNYYSSNKPSTEKTNQKKQKTTPPKNRNTNTKPSNNRQYSAKQREKKAPVTSLKIEAEKPKSFPKTKPPITKRSDEKELIKTPSLDNDADPFSATKLQLTKKYHIVAGSYKSKLNAERQMEKLKKLGFTLTEVWQYPQTEFYRVLVGTFDKRGRAFDLKMELQDRYGIKAYLLDQKGK